MSLLSPGRCRRVDQQAPRPAIDATVDEQATDGGERAASTRYRGRCRMTGDEGDDEHEVHDPRRDAAERAAYHTVRPDAALRGGCGPRGPRWRSTLDVVTGAGPTGTRREHEDPHGVDEVPVEAEDLDADVALRRRELPCHALIWTTSAHEQTDDHVEGVQPDDRVEDRAVGVVAPAEVQVVEVLHREGEERGAHQLRSRAARCAVRPDVACRAVAASA